MASRNEESSDRLTPPAPAFLLIQNGPIKGARVSLRAGQSSTIGRAMINNIIIPDEICSRTHCEIVNHDEKWMLRDLGSRNGTRVQGELISGDFVLTEGCQFQIGGTVLCFTFDVNRVLKDSSSDNGQALTATDAQFVTSNDCPTIEEVDAAPEIVHRTSETKYRSAGAGAISSRDRAGQEAHRLVRIGLKMGAAISAVDLSQIVLDELFELTSADIGAVLLLPNNSPVKRPVPGQLELVVYKSLDSQPFEQISDYVSLVVLETQCAVVALDVNANDRFKSSDSLNAMRAESIVCAPIRGESGLFGLIQLYSTNPDNRFDPDDSEFALTVADQMALALESIYKRLQLSAGLARAEVENQTLRDQLRIETELVGDSDAIRNLREKILRVAPTGAAVLIRGESGVGKELVARAIHEHSGRREAPFVTMNCAALSESLLESELFGHEKGAFTGAIGRKAGKFEQADGGTLFLDEVGEMSPSIQAKFLRVLEGYAFQRVGGSADIQFDVRVVAATNRDLECSVHEGTFRKDLYFRLQVMELLVAPLRERRSDIALLANHFLERFAAKSNRPVHSMSISAVTTLMNYPWPGNVRELQNTIERAVILCSGETLGPADIQLSSLGSSNIVLTDESSQSSFRLATVEAVEQEHIMQMLKWTDWNKSQAARLLGIERSTLDRKLKKYEMERPHH